MVQSALGAQETRSNGMSLFLQDTFNATDRLSFNLGVRTERFAHLATDGTNIFTFDWTLAPRLSGVVRPRRQRPAADQRVLRQVLRSDPQQPDQLRRDPHRIDPRRAGLRQ